MARFAFWLLFGGMIGGFPVVFCSKCCDDNTSCGSQVKLNSGSKCGKNENIFNNYCVSKCPAGQYAESGKCKGCAGACLSCNKASCLGCKSSSNFLTKSGLCESKCHSPTLTKSSSSPRTRLVQGRTSLEGVVEVYYDGSWGTVCADGWDMNAAKVLCKELKLGDVVEDKIVGQGRFRRSDGYKDTMIWLSGVTCSGKEDLITQCRHQDWGDNECSHLEDVGVRCSGPDTTKTCETSCSEGYYASNGKCLECPLDCKTCNASNSCLSCVEKRFLEGNRCVTECKAHNFGSWQTRKCKPCPDVCKTCIGTKSGVVKCTSCPPEKYLNVDRCESKCGPKGVALSKYLRLSGNFSTPYTGLLEVKYDGAWHTVCDDGFYLDTARVFCRELGYGQPIRYRGGEYGRGKGRILALDVHCQGTEKSFVECLQSDWFSLGCSHIEDVGLSCQPPAKGYHVEQQCIEKCPVGMFQSKAGGCELCNRKCLTCSGSPDNCETCRRPYYFNGTSCVTVCPAGTYSNATLGQCLPCNTRCLTCIDRTDKCLSCTSPYLLHNGTNCMNSCPDKMYRKGHSCVEDCGLRHYAKGKVCHACSSTCLACDSETKCRACKHGFVLTKKNTCDVKCPGDQLWIPRDPKSLGINLPVRLSNIEGSKFKGRLEIKHEGVWGSVCDDGWTYTNAEVVCRELFLGPPAKQLYIRSASFNEMNISKIWLDEVACNGNEDSLAECKHSGWERENCGHSEDVHIECRKPGVSTCEDECPAAYFQNGTTCEPCSVHCLNCTGPANNCSLCEKDFFRMADGRCIEDKCPPGFYEKKDSDKQHCLPCDPSCWTCSGSGNTMCTSCKRPDLLEKGECVQSCPSSSLDLLENPFIRLAVKKGPYEGVVVITKKGRTGFVCDRYLKIEDGHVVCHELQMKKALQVYERSMYPHYTTPILLKNAECTGSEASIMNCPERVVSYSYCSRRSIMSVQCIGPDLSSRCVPREFCSKEKGLYITDFGACGYCSKECLQCEKNASKCTACAKGFVLTWEYKCVQNCLEGTYYDTKTRTCVQCDLTKCMACDNSADYCTVCAGDKYLNGKNCLDRCVKGYKQSGVSTPRLSGGRNSSRGLVEVLKKGEWVSVCSLNWNIQAAVVICRELGYGDALRIYGQYYSGYLSKGILVANCTGRENSLLNCAKKDACNTRRLAGVECSRSTPKKQCVNSCGLGFFLKDGDCQPCSDSCASCANEPDQCLTCEWTHALHGRSCVENCPRGYFTHLESKTCKLCHPKCKTCFDGSSNDRCSSCDKPYFLRGTSCVDECYPDYSLEDLMKEEKPFVRLVNGSKPGEGFLQVFRNNEWALVCRKTTFIVNLVCRELGFENASSVGYSRFSDYSRFTRVSPRCKQHERSLNDCGFYSSYCYRPVYMSCSKKPLDKRMCRKENTVPCTSTTCFSQTTCVDGDDQVLRKGHSYCGHCPSYYFGDGANCTVIAKAAPAVMESRLYTERTIHFKSSYRLSCYGRSGKNYVYANRYSWYKNGIPLQFPESQSQHAYLRLGVIGYRAAGIYTCVLRSSAGATVLTYNVTVVGPPIITRADNVDVVLGNPVLLTCEVMANPPAVITWRLNNMTLGVNSTRHGGPRVLANGSLEILKPIKKDTGNYSCIATNEYGTFPEVVRLRIAEELRFERRANKAVAAKGDKAKIICRPLSTGRPMTIKWRRNGQTLQTGEKYDVQHETLTVKNVLKEDCGEYYCVARDGLSIITSVGKLIVKDEPPCIHTEPQDLLLEDGMYARFYCAAIGEPTPKILWQGKSQPKPNVFEIKKVNISHVGVYACTARSGPKSSNTAYAFLSVDGHHACPLIFQKPQDTSANFGKKATFYCKGVAVQPYSIVWYYRGNSPLKNNAKYVLTDGNRKLVINNVDKDDIGEYKCVVRGKNGEMSATASLTSAANVGAQTSDSSSPNAAGIVVGVLVALLVILIVLFFVYRYRRHGSTPADVIKDVKRKTISRFHSPTSVPHTILKYDTNDYVDNEEEEDEDNYDTSDTNPFVRD